MLDHDQDLPDDDLEDKIAHLTRQLIAVGHKADACGWVPATGGNFSARVEPDVVLITVSGCHKGELTPADFMLVDLQGNPLSEGKPSYETGLHCQRYRADDAINAVLHVHSISNTLLSRQLDDIRLTGFELQKILPSKPDPSETTIVPVFANHQNISALAKHIEDYTQPMPGYCLAGHGLYTWGQDIASAWHNVEALEFMFECCWQEYLATS